MDVHNYCARLLLLFFFTIMIICMLLRYNFFDLKKNYRYRTVESRDWVVLQAVNKTIAEVDHLQPGERYVIQVRSVSHHVESFTPEEVEQTVRKYEKSAHPQSSYLIW